ncbi:MAG: RelA/SpoT family protein [Alphaproteobacteria bacterium]|nr:MAG: hypothetical protein B6I23_02905 [Rickettsiaceae bacterium 4572_127]
MNYKFPSVEKLITDIKKYLPTFDEKLFRKAYSFGFEKHKKQIRHSGEPYFSHPVAVAEILIEQKLDLETIITGLLHDVIEDTPVSDEEMEELFGKSIAFLVSGVTKLSKVKLKSDKIYEAENFKKFIIACATDLRVLIVKLADRLHNMRTLGFHPTREKRIRKSVEVIEVYAPLAERIGMNRIKDELELLAFEHIEPETYQRIQNNLFKIRKEGHDLVEPIIEELKELVEKHGIKVSVDGREKTPPSIWKKMQRKSINFERIFDIIAFRFVAENITDCYRILGLIHSKYTMIPNRFKDYISTPKPNGYQSIHTTVVGPKNTKIEVQIRTEEMHEVAEFGVAAHWAYKSDEKLSAKPKEWLNSLVDSIKTTENPEELLEHSKLSGFNDAVFCFSPGGDLIDLPYGATTLDFAYAIHSDIGNSCIGAKANRKIISISRKLNNGDQIEILTSQNQEPKKEWLNYVKTGKAKTYIRRFLRGKQYSDMVTLGQKVLRNTFEKAKYKLREREVISVLTSLKAELIEDIYSQVGEGLRTPESVLHEVYPETKNLEDTTYKIENLENKTKKTRSKISTSLEGIAVKFAGCCHPLPGDFVAGVIHTGSGITIHKNNCNEVKKYEKTDKNKIMEIYWDQLIKETDVFYSEIKIMADNKQGALNSITQTMASQKINLHDIRIISRSESFVEFLIEVEVKNRDSISRLINALRTLPEIVNAERI